MIVYTITVIDVVGDFLLGNRRTPAIFTSLEQAISVVRDNDHDLNDNNLYQYAVIEKSMLDIVFPDLHLKMERYWFKFNTTSQEFEPCDIMVIPKNIARLRGFGIG